MNILSRPHLWCMLCVALTGCQRDDNGYRIVLIPKGLTHEHWQSVHRGAEAAARDLTAQGIPTSIIWDGPLRERDQLEQIRIVDRRATLGVDGVILAPQHSRTMEAPVKRCREVGVPVVIIDSGLDDRRLFEKYVATNNYHGGELAGEHLLKVLSDEGKTKPRLVLFRYQVGSQSTEQREQGFIDTVNRLCPDVEWVSTDKYAGATRDSASREAGPMIQQFGQRIDGIFAPNESSAAGMLDVLRSQGLNKKIHLMGFDASQPVLQAVASGDIDGLILQDPYRMGYLSTWVVVRHLQGDDVRRDEDLSTGEHLIKRDNIDLDSTKELFDPVYQAKRTIEVPTFLKRVKP